MKLEWLWVALALVVPPAAAAALVPVRDHIINTDTALLMVVVVVVLAVPGRRLAAAIAGLGAGVWFDFFLVKPYYSFTVANSDDTVTVVLLLVVGIVIGELTSRGRRHRQRAVEATVEISRIQVISGMVADGAAIEDVLAAVRAELILLLGLRDCWFETTFADRPGAFVERHGGVTWGALSWSTETMGLPSKEITLVVQGNGRPFGRFVLTPSVGVPVSLDRLAVAVALADQAGAAFATHASLA